jgi:hypothetical protein
MASEDVCLSVGDSAGEVGEVLRCPLQPRICAGEECPASSPYSARSPMRGGTNRSEAPLQVWRVDGSKYFLVCTVFEL